MERYPLTRLTVDRIIGTDSMEKVGVEEDCRAGGHFHLKRHSLSTFGPDAQLVGSDDSLRNELAILLNRRLVMLRALRADALVVVRAWDDAEVAAAAERPAQIDRAGNGARSRGPKVVVLPLRAGESCETGRRARRQGRPAQIQGCPAQIQGLGCGAQMQRGRSVDAVGGKRRCKGLLSHHRANRRYRSTRRAQGSILSQRHQAHLMGQAWRAFSPCLQ